VWEVLAALYHACLTAVGQHQHSRHLQQQHTAQHEALVSKPYSIVNTDTAVRNTKPQPLMFTRTR
jgi:vancomycin resistance protein YoaR